MKFAPIHRRALEKAARKLGGEAALAEFLGVAADVVHAWMNGTRILPSRMFTAVVDLIIAADPRHKAPDRTEAKVLR
jgi:hypothetical protein